MFFENVKRFENVSYAAMTHFIEGLSLETLLTLKVEKFLICLVGIRRPTISIMGGLFISNLR
jgi:hypothetical protein